MYRIIRGTTHSLPDTPAFIETLNRLEESPVAEARRLFDPGTEIIVARAPGRLDVMGGIADYSGSLVLQRTIAEATFAAIQVTDRPGLEVMSGARRFWTELQPIYYDEALNLYGGSNNHLAA